MTFRMPPLIGRLLLAGALGAIASGGACPRALAGYRRAPAVSGASQSTHQPRDHAAVMLEACVDGRGGESYGTFAAEMSAVPGAVQMAIRIDVQQRDVGQLAFHDVTASDTGHWRRSTPGVKVFRDVEQVTNLLSSREYRAVVRFRWLDALGRTLALARRTSPVCGQAASAGSAAVPGASPQAPAPRPSRRTPRSSR